MLRNPRNSTGSASAHWMGHARGEDSLVFWKRQVRMSSCRGMVPGIMPFPPRTANPHSTEADAGSTYAVQAGKPPPDRFSCSRARRYAARCASVRKMIAKSAGTRNHAHGI